MVKIRGGAFANIRNLVKMHHSSDLYEEILDALSASTRDLFESVLVYKEYYDLVAYQQFLEQLRSRVSENAYEQSARHIAEQDLKGIFLVFARMLSKEFLIKKMGSMWSKFYNQGTLSLIKSDDDASGIRVEGIHFNDAHLTHTAIYIACLLERATRRAQRYETKDLSDSVTEFWFYPLSQPGG